MGRAQRASARLSSETTTELQESLGEPAFACRRCSLPFGVLCKCAAAASKKCEGESGVVLGSRLAVGSPDRKSVV